MGALILFAALGAVVCAKAKAAGAAVLFALVAIVLFVATPAGQGLPGAIATFVDIVDGASTPVLTGVAPGSGAVG